MKDLNGRLERDKRNLEKSRENLERENLEIQRIFADFRENRIYYLTSEKTQRKY